MRMRECLTGVIVNYNTKSHVKPFFAFFGMFLVGPPLFAFVVANLQIGALRQRRICAFILGANLQIGAFVAQAFVFIP